MNCTNAIGRVRGCKTVAADAYRGVLEMLVQDELSLNCWLGFAVIRSKHIVVVFLPDSNRLARAILSSNACQSSSLLLPTCLIALSFRSNHPSTSCPLARQGVIVAATSANQFVKASETRTASGRSSARYSRRYSVSCSIFARRESQDHTSRVLARAHAVSNLCSSVSTPHRHQICA